MCPMFINSLYVSRINSHNVNYIRHFCCIIILDINRYYDVATLKFKIRIEIGLYKYRAIKRIVMYNFRIERYIKSKYIACKKHLGC